MVRYIIVDDEPIAHRIIEGYCNNLPYLEKKGNCYNAFEAIKFLSNEPIDLIFLDINMPKLSGFEFLKTLSNSPNIIVTTAYEEFALEGYELNIIDYLLKPFSFERFVKATNKIVNNKEKYMIEHSLKEKQTIFLKGDKKHHQVFFNEILYIEAYGNYSKIHLEDETILTHNTISSYEKDMPKNNFIRVHKSFIVAINKIKLIEGNRININKHKIPIGQTYKNEINKLLLS